jgi:CRP-like cAMP-binding protein
MIDLDKLKQLYKFSEHLSLSDTNELIKAAKSKSFEKKEIILEVGSNKRDVIFVREGIIRKYVINEKGEDITFQLIPENSITANVDVLFFNRPSKFYYEAMEKTEILSVDYNVLHSIISKNPKLQSSRININEKIMRDMHQRIESFVLNTPEERYLNFIKEHSDIANRIPDKYLSSTLGITPVSLSRIRKRIASQKS